MGIGKRLGLSLFLAVGLLYFTAQPARSNGSEISFGTVVSIDQNGPGVLERQIRIWDDISRDSIVQTHCISGITEYDKQHGINPISRIVEILNALSASPMASQFAGVVDKIDCESFEFDKYSGGQEKADMDLMIIHIKQNLDTGFPTDDEVAVFTDIIRRHLGIPQM